MGSSLPKFGRIDLDLEGSSEAVTAPPAAGPKRTPTFGELDLESILGPEYERPKPAAPPAWRAPAFDHTPPPSAPHREPLRETPTRQSIEAVKLAAEETRIAKAGVLERAVALSRRPPAPPPPVDGESCTRVGSFDAIVDGLLVEDPPSSRSSPSASGVASRDDRVAAMRELYAQGNADAALELASSVAMDLEHLSVEEDPFGGLILVDEDPFGGLEPVDDLGHAGDAEDHTAIVEASANSSRLAAMTSRQVPRLLVAPREISKLPMDPRTAFILGHIDGIQSMEEILDVCAMPESEALELIERLRMLKVITLD